LNRSLLQLCLSIRSLLQLCLSIGNLLLLCLNNCNQILILVNSPWKCKGDWTTSRLWKIVTQHQQRFPTPKPNSSQQNRLSLKVNELEQYQHKLSGSGKKQARLEFFDSKSLPSLI